MMRAASKYARPTVALRHQKVIAGVASGKSLTRAAVDAGFSPNYARTRLAKTLTFRQVVEEAFPDTLLTRVHLKLLTHKNWRANDAGLDKAYKLRGLYAPDQLKVMSRYRDLSDAELSERIKRARDSLTKR